MSRVKPRSALLLPPVPPYEYDEVTSEMRQSMVEFASWVCTAVAVLVLDRQLEGPGAARHAGERARSGAHEAIGDRVRARGEIGAARHVVEALQRGQVVPAREGLRGGVGERSDAVDRRPQRRFI